MVITFELSSVWWNLPPYCTLTYNSKNLWQGAISQKSCLSFTVNDDEPIGIIGVELSQKTLDDTVVDAEGKILKDKLLKIEKISIDEVELGYLIFLLGKFVPQYPAHLMDQNLPAELSQIDTFGFNGVWTLTFTKPFHIWYLENLP